MKLLELIKKSRKEKNISTYKMGDLLFMSHSNYQDIENGKTRMPVELFLKICEILELNPLELLKKDDQIHLILSKKEFEILQEATKVLFKISNKNEPDIHIKESFNNSINENISIGNINKKKKTKS